MAAHVVAVEIVPINSIGGVIDKETATIKEMLDASSDYRVAYASDVPNSVGHPTIKTYLTREAADNYVVAHVHILGMGQYNITTQPANQL